MAGVQRGYLGSYRLVRALAASQTCQIWEAIRDVDDARVAIKALHKRYASDRGQIATLQHEFEVGQRLDHPNVCRAFEYNVHRGTPFIVMEFMSPRSMKQLIRDQHEQMAWLIPDAIGRAAEGLGYFHRSGWISVDFRLSAKIQTEGNSVPDNLAPGRMVAAGYGPCVGQSAFL